MVDYAKKSHLFELIETTTNGSKLSPVLNRELVRVGLDRIRISIEGVDAESYQDVADVYLDWEPFIENIKDLYDHRGNCEIYIKTVDTSVDSEEKKRKFFQTFGDICDKIYIEKTLPFWPGYNEFSKYFGQSEKLNPNARELKVCPYPFYYMFILSDGTVMPCCADWQRRLIMGNVEKESLAQIWNGDRYNDLQKSMLKQGRSCRIVCSICSYPNCLAQDNIDNYAEDLLCRFEKDRVKYNKNIL